MTGKKPAAVAYVRVSSEEQLKKSATTIQTQTKKCADAAQNAGLELVKTFTDEGESAFTQSASERPQLQAMIAYLREHRRTVTHVVFTDLSRLARRIEDQAVLLAGFEKAGLKILSVDEPSASDNSAAGKLATGLLGLVNQFHSASLSERVTYRMRSGAQSGRHLHLAMLGYLNGTMTNGVKNIVPDPERAELVRKAFSLVADGHSLREVLRMVTALGLRSRQGNKLTKQSFSQMMHNRTYCGWVKSKDIVARGAFEPLISEELFERCQIQLNGRSRKQKHAKKHEDWPLRRFVLCGSCGKPLTSGWVKNSKGKPYGFYFCAQKGCRAVSARKEDIEAHWVNLLGMMQPTADGVIQVAEMAAAGWQHRRVRAEEEQRQLNARLTEQHTLNKQTIEARVKGKISDEDFTTMKAALASEVIAIEQGLKRLEDERTGMRELLKNTEVRLQNLATWWLAANLQDRVELQFSLWPDGLHWSHENFFLNTRNRSLYQMVTEMMRDLGQDGGR